MADFSGLNSTLNVPSANSDNLLFNLNSNNKQLKNRKNLNPVNVSSKIMKILQEHENECNEQIQIRLQQEETNNRQSAITNQSALTNQSTQILDHHYGIIVI